MCRKGKIGRTEGRRGWRGGVTDMATGYQARGSAGVRGGASPNFPPKGKGAPRQSSTADGWQDRFSKGRGRLGFESMV